MFRHPWTPMLDEGSSLCYSFVMEETEQHVGHLGLSWDNPTSQTVKALSQSKDKPMNSRPRLPDLFIRLSFRLTPPKPSDGKYFTPIWSPFLLCLFLPNLMEFAKTARKSFCPIPKTVSHSSMMAAVRNARPRCSHTCKKRMMPSSSKYATYKPNHYWYDT